MKYNVIFRKVKNSLRNGKNRETTIREIYNEYNASPLVTLEDLKQLKRWLFESVEILAKDSND